MTGCSILIPCFNAADFIASTLDSVIKNITPEDEIVIVDDHSQDPSFEIARQFLSGKDVNYQLVVNPSKGGCSARNHALSLARGEWIQWLDADDILGSGKIMRHRMKLQKHRKSIVICPFLPFIHNPRTGTIKENRDWDCSEFMSNADWLASGRMTIPACWMGNKELFEKAGPWNPNLKVNQDGEYFARVLSEAEFVIFDAEVSVWYRRGVSESVSHFTPEKAESLFSSIDSIRDSALALEDSPRMRQMLANKYQHAIYTAYPHSPELISAAQKKLKSLPKPTIANPNAVSGISKVFSRTFGWRALTQARMIRSRLTS
jgi:glycosyltransferase involved in cell wall biosynthesis